MNIIEFEIFILGDSFLQKKKRNAKFSDVLMRLIELIEVFLQLNYENGDIRVIYHVFCNSDTIKAVVLINNAKCAPNL